MRVFITFDGSCEPFDVSPDQTVGSVKLMVKQCGLPVSSFRLSSPTGLQLYDCNRLHDYTIDVGATLRLDTWDGWAEFLRGCFLGHKLTVQRHLSKERPVMRFQLRVALYIAASLGHLDLAGWLLERGVRAIEPVGVHPYREWCHQTAHPDAAKCPAVASIERGQLTILKLFIASSVLTLACRDPQGRDPLRIALQHGHRECVHHLATKLCSVVALPGMALPMRTYVQIKRWVRLGQRRAASRHCMGLNRAPFRTRVGDTVLVDGFTLPKMSSKPRRREAKVGIRVTSKASQPWSHVSCTLHALASQDAPLQLPKLHPVATRDGREKKRGKKKGCGGKGCEEDESVEQNSNQWRSRVPLPPISRDTNLRPVFASASPNSAQILTTSLESFSLHCDRTPRENAIYCLALARLVQV
uniref:Ankyrin repeat and ubiquitin domain containing 1 n=1 Tax=Hucho hucho TaxID=62062 RepID=A0A4W5JGR9_9TELE